MPQYVILFHQTPPGAPRPTHWDFLLECDSSCRTWALADQPSAGTWIPAQVLPDHRLHYLTYEGPVLGGRGHVRRWDKGEYGWREDTADQLIVWLEGTRLCGQAVLKRGSRGEWQFRFTAARREKGMGGASRVGSNREPPA